MTKIVGIDLGTTKSAIAVWQNGAPYIIPSETGSPIVPSVVAIDPLNGKWVVGERAKAIAIEHPNAAIYSAKRFIGRRYSDKAVQGNLEKMRILYEVEESRQRRDGIEVAIGSNRLTPQEVSAKVLQYMKASAETHLNHEITEAIITVPAYFHDSQRQATRDAGRITGLNVKRVLNEPTAACLAFGFKKLAEERKTVAVYDLGGGTFDISIVDIGRGPFRVRATNGDTYLGGDDLDWAIVDWVIEQIGGGEAWQLTQDVMALAQLRAAVEKSKKELSFADETQIQVKGELSPKSKITDVDLSLTQAQLKHLAEPFIKRTLESCKRALHDARLTPSEITEVLLVGGQTRMPTIREAVRDFFGVEPNISVEPEEVVALGAAVQAAILAGEAAGIKLADVVSLTLGVNTKGSMNPIIPRNTPIPVVKTKIYSTAEDNQESVEIQVYQGEAKPVADNIKLGEFILTGLAPAPAEKPEIEVTFHVDQDGILHVTGKDLYSGNFQEITITDSMRLSDGEIEFILSKAQAQENEDYVEPTT